jgi:hypothetical protein
VLAAVQGSTLCFDPAHAGAFGLDGASAQLTTWHLRDGREETAWSVQMLEFDAVFAQAYSVDISSVSHDTPPHRTQCMRSAFLILAPRGTIHRLQNEVPHGVRPP